MNEQEPQVFPDESGEPLGPQAAAQEALNVEVDGKEPSQPGAEGAEPGAGEGASEETWHDVLRVGIGALFGVASMRWPAMRLEEHEVETLAAAWAPVAEKHASAKIPIEAIAILATAAIVLPRIPACVELERQRKAQRRAEKPREEVRQSPESAPPGASFKVNT